MDAVHDMTAHLLSILAQPRKMQVDLQMYSEELADAGEQPLPDNPDVTTYNAFMEGVDNAHAIDGILRAYNNKDLDKIGQLVEGIFSTTTDVSTWRTLGQQWYNEYDRHTWAVAEYFAGQGLVRLV